MLYFSAMEITTYSRFRQNLKQFLDFVLKNKSPLFVTRVNKEDVVVLSKSDYDSMQETLYLLGSSKNIRRLTKGIKEYEEGKAIKRELIE